MRQHPLLRGLSALVAAAALSAPLAGCEALFFGGAMVGTGLVATNRRTAGTQLEDESIELKAASRVSDLATLGHVSITSYNRLVLITGEVPGENERVAVGRAVSGVENVRAVVNELAVMPNSSFGSRSNDTLITTKIKASFVEAKDLQSNAIKVVSERGIVYLMGIVTQREADRAAQVASGVAGVQKVVRVFDIVTEAQLANIMQTNAAQPPGGAASGAGK